MANPVKRYHQTPWLLRQQKGVSLAELIVSISTVILLVGITVPIYSRVTRLKDQAVCNANLRQIGVAIINYANEHQGILPGPVTATQRASYTAHQIKTAPISLVHYLAPYLGIPSPPAKQSAAIFECPAQAKLRRGEDDAVFYLHRDTVLRDGPTQRPFGYQASGSTPRAPMRLTNVVRPPETVAIFDTSGTTVHPEVHLHIRNVLFIDGHTESVDVNRLSFDATKVTIR